MTQDTDSKFLEHLAAIGREDAAGLHKAFESYGPSWKRRGGVGAFMMMARKWDRLENGLCPLPRSLKSQDRNDPSPAEAAPPACRLGVQPYDIFEAAAADRRAEGVIDDIRDLRRYLMLIEAELRARGVVHGVHRDNKIVLEPKPPAPPKPMTTAQALVVNNRVEGEVLRNDGKGPSDRAGRSIVKVRGKIIGFLAADMAVVQPDSDPTLEYFIPVADLKLITD